MMASTPGVREGETLDDSSGSNSSNSRGAVTVEVKYVEEKPGVQKLNNKNAQLGNVMKRDIPRSFSCGETPVNSVVASNSRKRRDSGNDEELYRRSLGSQYKNGTYKDPDLSKLLPFVDASVPIVIDNEPMLPAAVADDYDGWNALVDSFYSGVGKTSNKSSTFLGGGCRRGKGGFLAERFRVPILRILFLSKLDGNCFDGTHLTRWIIDRKLEHSIDLIGILGYASQQTEYSVSSIELQERAIQGDLSVNISLLEGICPRVVFVPGPFDPQLFRVSRYANRMKDRRLHLTNNSYHLYRHGLKLADDLLLVDPASFRQDYISNYQPFLVCKDWNIWNFHALHRLSGQLVSWKEQVEGGLYSSKEEASSLHANEKTDKRTSLENNVKRNELEDMGVIAMMSCERKQGLVPLDPIWVNILKHRCLFCVEYGSDESEIVWTCSEQKQANIYPGNFSKNGEFVMVEITRSWQTPYRWMIHSVQKMKL
ncbi:hypothetical protein GpartN1_g4172.t1 [Galdieria partita]|uniref:Uncharacterized protein n=1 Tax=Galdieria partita TaxID=83374 RepID=A0A9C7PXF6_9RHOD|nr:hypothetical protein GpartN1_g4172.t1 [Galdieria partita]